MYGVNPRPWQQSHHQVRVDARNTYALEPPNVAHPLPGVRPADEKITFLKESVSKPGI